MDGKNLRHHGHHQKLSVEPDICVRTRLPFSERVNPYVAPRHVIARYCAITLHLAVIQMHRGPIGEAPQGQKSSTFLPDLHLSSQSRSKARTPRVPRIPNSRPSKSATRSSSLGPFRRYFEIVSTQFVSFPIINVSRTINLSPMEVTAVPPELFVCETGGNPRRSVPSIVRCPGL